MTHRRFLTWLRTVLRLPSLLQGIRDGRRIGQCDHSSAQLAVLGLLRAFLLATSNSELFDFLKCSRPAARLAGFRHGIPCSQSTFERTLPRFDLVSLYRCRTDLLKRIRRSKMFSLPIVIAIDGKVIPVPNGSYEGHHLAVNAQGVSIRSYTAVFATVVGPHNPPVILGAQVDGSKDEHGLALALMKRLLREIGPRFIDTVVADRLYVSHAFVNLLEAHGIRVVLDAKEETNVLKEGRTLLEQETTDSSGYLDDAFFRFREVDGLQGEWRGLEVKTLRLIEATQVTWPDPRGKRKTQVRYILTTHPNRSTEWINAQLHRRWWIESTNSILEHQLDLEHLPSKSLAGIRAFVELLTLAYSITNLFLARQLGGSEAFGTSKRAFRKLLAAELTVGDVDGLALVCVDTS